MEKPNQEVVRKLAAKMLKRASREFGSHECNDVEADFLNGVSEHDRFVLEEAMNKWNCPTEEPDQFVPINRVPDFFWMSYLAKVLESE